MPARLEEVRDELVVDGADSVEALVEAPLETGEERDKGARVVLRRRPQRSVEPSRRMTSTAAADGLLRAATDKRNLLLCSLLAHGCGFEHDLQRVGLGRRGEGVR